MMMNAADTSTMLPGMRLTDAEFKNQIQEQFHQYCIAWAIGAIIAAVSG
jgi:hypothetical protein